MNVNRQLDERALEFLFRDHFTGLCQFAVGYIKDTEAAKEIVQDAFVSLWEKRDSIDMSKPVKTYLSTTVRNRCLNYLRDHKKFSSDLLALENLSIDTIYDQPDKLVESDIHQQISRAIEELPEKCREIFKLSRHQNLKYQQIADELQISVKTVETQMSKALQHMRLRLAEYLPVFFVLILPLYYFTYYILHFRFCTLHFAFCIFPFAFCTLPIFIPISG